jgi:hypothetical protein
MLIKIFCVLKVSLRMMEQTLLYNQKGSFYSCCLACSQIVNEHSLLAFRETKTTCPRCAKKLTDFFCFDVLSQLERIVKKKGVLQQLKRAKERALERNTGQISTQLDGSVYQTYIREPSSCLTISLNLNSDGAPLLKQKSVAIWPHFASIVELDTTTREKCTNLVFLGNNTL